MKLHTSHMVPSPRRVHLYLAEKGLTNAVTLVEVDIRSGAQRGPEFLAKNPFGQVPVLELDDGRCLTESLAIMEYLEHLYPTPPLFGGDPWERARMHEALRVAELYMALPIGNIFVHTHPMFAGRVEQAPAIVASQKQRFAEAARVLDGWLADRRWLAGAAFTVADLTLQGCLEAAGLLELPIDPGLRHLGRWRAAMTERPSLSPA